MNPLRKWWQKISGFWAGLFRHTAPEQRERAAANATTPGDETGMPQAVSAPLSPPAHPEPQLEDDTSNREVPTQMDPVAALPEETAAPVLPPAAAVADTGPESAAAKGEAVAVPEISAAPAAHIPDLDAASPALAIPASLTGNVFPANRNEPAGERPHEELPIFFPVSEAPPHPAVAHEEIAGDAQPDSGVNAAISASQRRRTVRTAPTRESFEAEVDGYGLSALSPEYLRLNQALARACLLSGGAGQKTYLTVTPRVLAGVLGREIRPEDAERMLCDAVTGAYRSRVLADARRLDTLRRLDGEGFPECIAFLALAVLAAYRMHTDADMAGNDYYGRLCDLLQCGSAGNLPRGFEPELFEGLWIFTEAWLRGRGLELAMPGPEAGIRRYVALPLCHVPLRQLDMDRLPDFFHWARYAAGENVPPTRLEADFERWAPRNHLTGAGAAAWGDLRRGAVLSQVLQELGCWDGTVVDAQGRNWAPVEIYQDWQRRLPVVSFLARRPGGFPSSFAHAGITLEGGQDGWFEPVPMVPEDGVALAGGIEWQAVHQGGTFILSRKPSPVVPLVPCEFAGYMSHHGLLSDAVCAVLCAEDRSVAVEAYLSGVTGVRCTPVGGTNLPSGWKLYTHLKPVHRIQPPAGLENLEVLSTGQVFLRGGLKLGRRASWLVGAPPEIHAVGFRADDRLRLNDLEVPLNSDGQAAVQGMLDAPGEYQVEIGGVRRAFTIEEAMLPPPDEKAAGRQWAVALPTGTWTVLGYSYGSLAVFRSGSSEPGMLARTSFEPVWALSCGTNGRGSSVICFASGMQVPAKIEKAYRPDETAWRWADAIFSANIRRPQVVSDNGGADAGLRQGWGRYVEAAREIKRRIRRDRR